MGVSPERFAEAHSVVDRVTRWAEGRANVVGLLLVGSYARCAARPDSDVDLVLLTRDLAGYDDDSWIDELSLGELIRVGAWGVVNERRFVTPSGLEVEIGLSSCHWASTEPIDNGTRGVVSDGAVPLHDPTGVLAPLIRATA